PALAAAAAPAPAATAAPAPAPAAAAAPLRVLATGDSMMLLTDIELRAALEDARVVSDIRVATGLTKPHLLDWRRHAVWQARRHRPDVVIAAMGANDAYALRRARCCGRRWVARYARRIDALARAWRRGGADRVYWLTLPAPQHAKMRRQFDGVNAAVRRARRVRTIDTRPLLSPDGEFHAELETSPGTVERVRSTDGVHLWWPGARMVAAAIEERLRADGVLPGGP
ncbi:MAG TPA: hypothetical protein VHF89_19950, partial [Solirubrobacteraceae bacterium]|nr:hypothetical protein [Solirubrobacteraceae bacterium]